MKKNTNYLQRLSWLNLFSKAEAAEIPKLLMPGEQVLGIISGFYSAGSAVLCVTSKRLLLVDKKLIRLSFEDVRYESIKEVSYNRQLIFASVKFYFAGRSLNFKTWFRTDLRLLAQLVQDKIFEVHQREEGTSTSSTQMIQQEGEATSHTSQPQIQSKSFEYNPQMEQYLQNRVARWRRASRFVNGIPSSTVKTSSLDRQLEEV